MELASNVLQPKSLIQVTLVGSEVRIGSQVAAGGRLDLNLHPWRAAVTAARDSGPAAAGHKQSASSSASDDGARGAL